MSEQNQTQPFRVEISGTPIFAEDPRASAITPPEGFKVLPIALADAKPPGTIYDESENAFFTPVNAEGNRRSPSLPPGAEVVPSGVDMGIGLTVPRMITEPFSERTTPPIPPGAITSSPSIRERAEAVGEGVLRGGVKGAPMTAGLVMGAKAGVAAVPFLAPFIGPFAAAAPFVGGAAGLVLGYFAGEELSEIVPAQLMREDLKPYAQGGESAGLALTSFPAAFFARGTANNVFGRMMENIGRNARARPKTFIAAESLTAGTIGVAAGTSETVFPGQAGPRFAAELGAGIFTPGRFAVTTVSRAYDQLGDMIRTAKDPNSMQLKQARALYKVLDRVQSEIPAIQQLETLGTPKAMDQAKALRASYYERLIKDLEKLAPSNVNIPPAMPTAAQKTGDLGLSVLELSLIKRDGSFGTVVTEQGKQAMRTNQLLLDAMRNIPDEGTLALVAQKQAELYDQMVAGGIAQAEKTAADAVTTLRGRVPDNLNRTELGRILKPKVAGALQDARDFEKKLWGDSYAATLRTVPSGLRKGEVVEREMIPKELLRGYLDQITSMTMERATSSSYSEVTAIMRRLGITQESIASYQKGKLTAAYLDTGVVPDEFLISGVETLKNGKTRVIPLGNKTTVGDLVNIRSDLLKYTRDAAAGSGNRSPSDARFFGMLSESVLDDLQKLNSSSYDKARAFSKSLNDIYTRTYAGDLSKVQRSGRDKIPAELVISDAFGRNADATAMRIDEIENAVGFFKNLYNQAVADFGPESAQALALKGQADIASGNVNSVTQAIEKSLYIAASDPTILNPQTNRINPQALASWMERNKTVIKSFGSLTNDLKNALDAENALRSLGNADSAINRQLRDEQSFALLLPGGEKPSGAVTSILNGDNPASGMRKLTNIIKNSGLNSVEKDGALRGLKSTLFDYAYSKAGGTSSNKFNIKEFDDALFKPLAPNQSSVVQIMRDSGLMTLTEIKNLRRLMNPMMRIENSLNNKQYLDEVIESTGPLSQFAVRFLSLHATSDILPSGPGSLAAASAVSSASKDVFTMLPRINALAALKESILDPQATANLLRVGRNQAEKLQILQEIEDSFTKKGLLFKAAIRTPVPVVNVLPPAQEKAKKQGEAARQLRQLPPAPTTRGLPKPEKPKAPGAQSSSAPASPNARAMMQSLFPFDSISALAGQQQPPAPG